MHGARFPVPAFDRHWFFAVNGLAHSGWSFLNPLMVVLARYSPEIWVLIFLLLWFWPPLTASRMRRALIYAAVAGVLALAINAALGHLLPYRPRPFVLYPHLVYKLIPHAADTSFPSDHAAGSFAFALAFLYGSRRAGAWAFLFAAGIALARVWTGVHWPTDVLAGAVIGLFSAVVVLRARRLLEGLVRFAFRLFRMSRPRLERGAV
ncbi:Phosphoesterase [Candidatus Hydrogenisulfobacillus filiaventi]|uniref:Phosphoesterase n=1 Tax=Candidatus Hydrogenisulfobacillus filiaventi TaxID=2707344 RepID=A0A6F8ZGT1_9FIRM|nr:phosphatase PAP2 family protein [Bacillota bacterium]CAB1128996.1 Phosphoesterase [Candidatus Hydrogenisulfobacillus filiaventi]